MYIYNTISVYTYVQVQQVLLLILRGRWLNASSYPYPQALPSFSMFHAEILKNWVGPGDKATISNSKTIMLLHTLLLQSTYDNS